MTAVTLLFGCEQRERSEERANVSDLQQQSEESLEKAQQAQEQASAEQKDAMEAREDISKKQAAVESAQQELESAEDRAVREAQEAQQAQQEAASVSRTAQEEAATTQQQAQELQQQQSEAGVGGSGPTEPAAEQPRSPGATETRPFTGDQANIAGKVESAGQGSLVLLEDSGQRTTLAVHPQTQVLIDGQAASLEQLQEGSQIRASFDPSTDQDTPGRIEIQTLEKGQQQPAPQQEREQQQY